MLEHNRRSFKSFTATTVNTQAVTLAQSGDSAMKSARSLSGAAGGTAGLVVRWVDKGVCTSALPVKCREHDRAHFLGVPQRTPMLSGERRGLFELWHDDAMSLFYLSPKHGFHRKRNQIHPDAWLCMAWIRTRL